MSLAGPDVAAMDNMGLVRMRQIGEDAAQELESRHRLATQPCQPMLSPAEVRRRLSKQLDGRPSSASPSSGSARQPRVDVDLGVS